MGGAEVQKLIYSDDRERERGYTMQGGARGEMGRHCPTALVCAGVRVTVTLQIIII